MRLIDADELINDIKNCLWDWESVDGITATTVLKQTISDIENQPTIEPYVHCVECKHGEKLPTFQYYPNLTWCNKYERSHDGDWFCADGEKQE